MCSHASHYRFGKLASLTGERSRCQHQATESICFTDHARECSRCQHQATVPIYFTDYVRECSRCQHQATVPIYFTDYVRECSRCQHQATVPIYFTDYIRECSRCQHQATVPIYFTDYVREWSRCQHQATVPIYLTDYVRECSCCQHQATVPISLWNTLGNAHVVNMRPLNRSTSWTMLGMTKRLASRIYTLEYFCQYLYASHVTRCLLMNKFTLLSFIAQAKGRHFTARSLRMLFEDLPLHCITISLSKGDQHFSKVQSSGAV